MSHYNAWLTDVKSVTFRYLKSCNILVYQRQTQVENDQLVPKRETASEAWSRVFKHCSFKTTDFKPLKIKQQSYMCAPSNTSYMCAPSLSVWEKRLFFFADFE